MSTRIYVIRHGESESNQAAILSGYSNDPPLTKKGVEQAKKRAEALAHINFDEVYSSDLQRAVHTAAIIAGKEVHPTKRLKTMRERKFGAFDGSPYAKFSEMLEASQYEQLSPEEKWHFKHAEDMESDEEVATRAIEALTLIGEDHPDAVVLVGAHGSLLRTLITKLGFFKLGELQPGSIENTAYVEIIYDNGTFSIGETGGIHKTNVS